MTISTHNQKLLLLSVRGLRPATKKTLKCVKGHCSEHSPATRGNGLDDGRCKATTDVIFPSIFGRVAIPSNSGLIPNVKRTPRYMATIEITFICTLFFLVILVPGCHNMRPMTRNIKYLFLRVLTAHFTVNILVEFFSHHWRKRNFYDLHFLLQKRRVYDKRQGVCQTLYGTADA